MKNILASIADTLSIVHSASRVVSAIQLGDTPNRRDLERLGIDPVRFASLRSVHQA